MDSAISFSINLDPSLDNCRYVILQRQKAVLLQRLKVPPPINQFSMTLDRPTATQVSNVPWLARTCGICDVVLLLIDKSKRRS